MSRGRNRFGGGREPSITRIELDEKPPSRARYILLFCFVAIALFAFGYGLYSYLYTPAGWTRITPSYTVADSCSSEMAFYYELGASGNSANAEERDLSRLYAELSHDAYVIFTADKAVDGVQNPYYINTHVGEAVDVDPALYAAFERLAGAGSRLLYAAPYHEVYYNVFSATEDIFAAENDPDKNADIAAYFADVSAFVNSDNHVKLELLGDCRVKLTVSEAYRAFAAENGIERYIDFHWARNAFSVDYIADALERAGYVYGYIASYDGFTRNLDPRATGYGMNLYTRYEGRAYIAAQYAYTGRNAIVSLRAFPVVAGEERYYVYASGETCCPYVDVTDGRCRASADSLTAYAADKDCADILLALLPAYVSEQLNTDTLGDMATRGVYSMVCDGTRLIYTEADARITPAVIENVTVTKEMP